VGAALDEQSIRNLRQAPLGWARSSPGVGGEPIQAQPIEEFEIRVTELVRPDPSIIGRPIDWADRRVLGQQIGPHRSWVLHLLHCHPDDSEMGRWLSPHSHALLVLPGVYSDEKGAVWRCATGPATTWFPSVLRTPHSGLVSVCPPNGARGVQTSGDLLTLKG